MMFDIDLDQFSASDKKEVVKAWIQTWRIAIIAVTLTACSVGLLAAGVGARLIVNGHHRSPSCGPHTRVLKAVAIEDADTGSVVGVDVVCTNGITFRSH